MYGKGPYFFGGPYYFGGFGGYFVLKSGLRILIWAPEVPFLEPTKWPKRGHFSHFGGTRNGASGVRNKILNFQYKLAPKTPKKTP